MAIATTSTDETLAPVAPFWMRYRNEIIGLLAVLIIGLTAFGIFRYYQQHREDEAAGSLATAKTPAEYQKVIDDFSGSAAAGSAYLLLASSQANEKKFAEANATLQQFVDKYSDHELASAAHLAMAANLEEMGKADEALTALRRLVANYPKSYNAPVAMLSEIRLLKNKNQIAEARKLCETFLTQYRDSYLAGEASRQLELLKAKQPVATAAPAQPSTANPMTAPIPPAAPTMPPPANPAPNKKP